MWDFFNMRRRARQRSRASNGDNNSQNSSSSPVDVVQRDFRLRSLSQPFFIPTQPVSESPPKCLSRIPCSQILYGDRVEDFSTNCWLENQLHRFGLPESRVRGMFFPSPLDIEEDDSITSSSGSSNSTIGYSSYEFDSDGELIMPERPRLALEELFLPPFRDGDEDFDTNERLGSEAPPPYTQFPEEPPPTYEEAVGCDERRSNGTRSSSSSLNLAFMW